MAKINWESVSSSNIDAVAFEKGDMYVRFQSGGTYRYFGVPEQVFKDCRDSASVGGYFAANIRGRYPDAKV